MELLVFLVELSLRLLALLLLGAGSAAGIAAAVLLFTKNKTAKAEAAQQISGAQRFALDTVIETAVQAAQQTIAKEDRFVFVKGHVLQAAQQLGIEITDAQLNLLIESAVYQLKQYAAK